MFSVYRPEMVLRLNVYVCMHVYVTHYLLMTLLQV